MRLVLHRQLQRARGGLLLALYCPSNRFSRAHFPARAGGTAPHGLTWRCKIIEDKNQLLSQYLLSQSIVSQICGVTHRVTKQQTWHGIASEFNLPGLWMQSREIQARNDVFLIFPIGVRSNVVTKWIDSGTL